jgi:glucosylglycerol-phosphate synthase
VILDGAVLTNPYSHKQMDQAIDMAIDMPESEQLERMEKMSSAVEAFTVSDWADEQMSALEIQD